MCSFVSYTKRESTKWLKLLIWDFFKKATGGINIWFWHQRAFELILIHSNEEVHNIGPKYKGHLQSIYIAHGYYNTCKLLPTSYFHFLVCGTTAWGPLAQSFFFWYKSVYFQSLALRGCIHLSSYRPIDDRKTNRQIIPCKCHVNWLSFINYNHF